MIPDKDRPQPREEKAPQQAPPINLDDYAGDEEDDALARKQANNYIHDTDKGLAQQKENIGPGKSNQ